MKNEYETYNTATPADFTKEAISVVEEEVKPKEDADWEISFEVRDKQG